MSYLVPKRYYLQRKWRQKHSGKANVSPPVTFNEKLYWELLNSNNQLARDCSDKIGVRQYVASIIGSKYLNPIYGVFRSADDIDLSTLPDSFVLKNTHDSSSILLVPDKNDIDYKRLVDIDIRLSVNYGKTKRQWVYDKIKPRMIAERYLADHAGQVADDYKVFCFNGVAKIIQVDTGRFQEHKQSFYNRYWRRLSIYWDHAGHSTFNVKKPPILEQLISLSELLAAPFNHVRVDWYLYRGELIFGEMTFFHMGGLGQIHPKCWDQKMGAWFRESKDLGY